MRIQNDNPNVQTMSRAVGAVKLLITNIILLALYVICRRPLQAAATSAAAV